ncbi:sperm-associated antigen 17 [Cololabis saira]|uniref:sperm-associated antigen 17 n=1 Tax=Cololabis saira TaxID=129043 RepID=UPI002AD2B341|nr:sperm-associated antigen 17 [Cololabis saira]
MPPKTAKTTKKPNSAGAPAGVDVVSAQFEEDLGQACVSLVAGGSPEEEELIQALTLAVQQPQRKLFTLLSWDSVRAKILTLGKSNAKKGADVGISYEVAESATALLEAGEEIPCDLMATILKSQLLQIKATDKQRREAEQLKTKEGQKTTKDATKAPKKKGKDSSSAHEPSKEKETKLRRRDDVDPPIFKDDEPECGPQHYILLVGFHHLHLIWMLDGIGVHVANVIKLCSEQTQTFGDQQEQHSCEEMEQRQRPSPVLDADLTVQAMELELFWSGLRSVLDCGPPDSKLHDVVQLSYTVPHLILPLPTRDPDAMLELGSQIFEGVANLIYDCLDWRKDHQHYRDNVRLITVPAVLPFDSESAEVVQAVVPKTPRSKIKSAQKQSQSDQETKVPGLTTDVDMCYYNALLDRIPPEACSVPLILNCMLEQVVVNTDQSSPPTPCTAEGPNPATGPWSDYQRVSCMLENFLPLIHTEEEKTRMLDNLLTTLQKTEDKTRLMERFGGGETQKESEQTQVIRHHDERAQRLKDVSVAHGFNPADVELSMMKFSPVWDLIQSETKQRSSQSCWMQIKQQLQHYCTDDSVSWTDVERLFHQSIFEAMTLTTLDQQGVLLNAAKPQGSLESAQQQTETIIPWDNPLSYAKKQLHNLQTKGLIFLTEDASNMEVSGKICSQLDLSHIQSCRRRSLIDWHYVEHHDAAEFQQVLQLASEEYCCLDTFRGSLNNTLYIFCHNPMNSHRQCKEFWEVSLHTDVKFRNYLEHVVDTISDWTREEELKREAMRISHQGLAETPKDEKAVRSVEEKGTLEPVTRKDSLKAWKIEQERLKEEEMAGKSKKEKAPKGKKQKEDNKKSGASPSNKESKLNRPDSSTKAPTEKREPLESEIKDLKEEPISVFTGYSMDGQLIRVSGHIQHLFPSDGGHITVENVTFFEGSSMMKLAVKDRHHFYTHINQVMVDPAKPPSPAQDKKITDPKDCKVSGPVEKKRVNQASLSVELDNKIRLSYSFYGPMGEYTEGNSPQIFTQEPTPPSSSTCHSKDANPETVTSSRQTSQGCEDQPDLPSSSFNSLNVYVPNGLFLQFLRDDAQEVPPQERGILVKQSFPLHGRGERPHLKDTSLSKEQSCIVTSLGAVIRCMRDGSTEVLFADGSVSFSQDSGPVWVPVSEVQRENSCQGAKDAGKGRTSVEDTDAQKGWWQTTSPSGSRICTIGTTHKHIPTTSLLTRKETDPITHQVMLSREDLVVSVQNPDGSRIVEHADGTRITSLLQDRPLITTTPNLMHAAVSTKEQVVLVEKEGCAKVMMYPERQAAHIFLADGTVITGNNHGEYQVFPSSGGFMQIQTDGRCMYSSDPLVTHFAEGFTSTHQPRVYTMSHTSSVVCDVTDSDGNHFQVMEDGRVSVLNIGSGPNKLNCDAEDKAEDKEEDRDMSSLHRYHCPRLFLVHEDGSGTEFLGSHSVEGLLRQLYADPTVALLKERLPDKQDEFGITVLKPSFQSVWLPRKQNPDITPPGLKNRSWHDFPAVEKKTSGPPFGTDLGFGLTLKEKPVGFITQRQPVGNCPKVLEMRELYQHRPFTTPLKNIIDSRLKEYIERLMEQEQQSEEMKGKDPRTEEESACARDLIRFLPSFAEEDVASHAVNTKIPADVERLYSQAIGASAEQSDVLEDSNTGTTDSLDTTGTTDSLDTSQELNFCKRKELKWTERLAKHRQELSEEKTCRESLRAENIVPYFHPENIPSYQSLFHDRSPDMWSLSMDPPPIPKSDSPNLLVTDSPEKNTSRPLNPTPSQSESHTAGADRMPDIRPTNPTPQTAGESSVRASPRHCKSVLVDVTGKPRRTKIRLPTCILDSKPCSMPNQHFLSVEEPVRRKCRTVSVNDPRGPVRGFQLLPSSVDFGTVQEGTSSTFTVVMRNVGVDTWRFQVKQPPLATGLRVIYNPGPVPAGLHVELKVQLFASCAVEAEGEPKQCISQDITIHSETEILYLPVTAIILPKRLHDQEQSSARKKRDPSTFQRSPRPGNHSTMNPHPPL